VKKNRLNWLEFLKNRPVRFHKPETEKTEPNRTQTEKTEPNRKNQAKPEKTKLYRTGTGRFEPVFVLKKLNQTEPGRFEPVSVFFKKLVWLFFDKNQTEPKVITPNKMIKRRRR
jgi:hypothetical protein